MQSNRVKDLRRARGLTLAALADKVGTTHTHISRIENGQRGLSIPMAERIAKAMNTTLAEVIGVNGAATPGAELRTLQEDASPYLASQFDLPIQPRRGENIDPWLVTTDALDKAGIPKGAVVFVDISAAAVEALKPLQCVVAQVYRADRLEATTILRQFVPPSLLITNSSGDNDVPRDIDKGEAYVKGVIVGKWQQV